jgi:hypothetical protein
MVWPLGGWPTSEIWVPHLRRGFIATKVGHRAKARSVSVFRSCGDKVRFAAVATEGDEVVVAFSLESFEA